MLTILLAPLILGAHRQLPVYQDPSASATARAANLVSMMTVDEKISQCMMDEPAIPRLHIPAYHFWSEALHGIANNGVATVFPQAIAMASTWDPQLLHSVAETISTEARGKYYASSTPDRHRIFQGITLWSPNINIFRDPRWGRGQETYGEDPFLTSRMGVAFVSGIQGDDPAHPRCVATPKHFAVHSGPEPLRHAFHAQVTEKELRETYLPAFEACVREGKAQSIMSAYSGFNGKPDTANPWLLTTLLRDEWGFNGAVVSDVDSVADIWQGHRAAADQAEASAMAIKAGNDLCSGTTYQGLKEALKRGLIQESDIDRAAQRLYTLKFRLGMFDASSPHDYDKLGAKDVDTPEHEKLALRAAEESLVLLKNDGILPLKTNNLHRVAIIGPAANSQRVLEGNYNGTPGRPSFLGKAISQRLEASGVTVKTDDSIPFTTSMIAGHPIPTGSLFTSEDHKTAGLTGEVFGNINLGGTPIATRVDQKFDFEWGNGVAYENLPMTDCSIRWTGEIVWPRDEKVDLKVVADDGVRMYLDGKLVINEWREQAPTEFIAPYHFRGGKPVHVKIEYYQRGGGAEFKFGYSKQAGDSIDFSQAEKLARESDLTILTLGITADLESEESSRHEEGFLGGDRTSIDLPAPQLELLRRIVDIGKPVVLLTTSGSCLSVPTKGVGAWLQCWYPGEQGGKAAAEVLAGDVNPGGHLPVTFYKSVKDLPPFEDYHLTGRTYRFFKGAPLFPFGYGLSYSTFKVGEATVREGSKTRTVTVPVTNTSQCDGDQVLQVYARYAQPTGSDPIKRLVGFTRVSVKAGQTVDAKIEVSDWALRSWNEATHHYEVRPGNYLLDIGNDSQTILTETQFSAN